MHGCSAHHELSSEVWKLLEQPCYYVAVLVSVKVW